MSCVKCEIMFGGDLYLAREHALSKGAARFIAKHLSDAAELVYKTSDSCVGCPNHRTTRFHTSKNCVRQMLMRPGGMQKPTIVCYIYQQIRAGIRFSR